MKLNRGASFMFIFLLLIFCYASELSISTDFISSTRSLRDPETITSNGGIFRMGFFTPSGSNDRYVGIWYNGYSYLRPVWVANREKPIKDSSGMVMISEDGNLVIQDGKEAVVWSSNVTNTGKGNVTVRLLDTGNLVVLLDSNSTMTDPPGASGGITIWQSFEHMSDSFLPEMALIGNARTNVSRMITSWKSLSDPSPGAFSLGIKPLNIPEVFIWNRTRPYWRSGPWNGQSFIGLPSMESFYQYGFSFQNDNEGNLSLTYSIPLDFILYYVLEPNGTLLESYSVKGKNERGVSWSSHMTDCDVYGKCGPFGICDPSESPICSCPRGFRPGDLDEWGHGNWSGGCVRKTSTNCGSSDSHKKDGFLRIPNMKVPAFPDLSFLLEDGCARSCSSNCSCLAHAYDKGVGCMSWGVGLGLIDMQKLSGAGVDVHIRLPTEELGNKARNFRVVMATASSIGVVSIALSVLFLWMHVRKRRAMVKFPKTIFSDQEESPMIIYGGNSIQDNLKLQDLKLISFKELSTATDSFNSVCKLGEGGFGPVYMGKLSDGQKVAIKRLSRASGQGLEELLLN